MSSSLSSIGPVDNAIDVEREGQKVAQSLHRIDNSPQETGFRGKLRRFWQRARIPSVVKKVLVGSKSLLRRLAPRLASEAASIEPMQSGVDNTVPRVEIVKFPEDMFPSPASSSNEASLSAFVRTPTSQHTDVGSSPLKPVPNATLSLHHVANDPVVADPQTTSEIANEKSFGDFRYTETLEKQKSFPEIKRGVVVCRLKWLEPLFSGEKAEDENASQKENETGEGSSGNEKDRAAKALEIYASSGLAPTIDDGKVENARSFHESDKEPVSDNSPRLFKHRLPEEEPIPWVEPGTVAKGALRLQVMSGEKRMCSVESEQENPTSPTRVWQATFR